MEPNNDDHEDDDESKEKLEENDGDNNNDDDMNNSMMINVGDDNIFTGTKRLFKKFSFNGSESERIFYNLFNAEIVIKKSYDFGWSKYVDHENMLIFIKGNKDEMMMNETFYETSQKINNAVKVNYNLKNHKIPISLFPYIIKQDDIVKTNAYYRNSGSKDIKGTAVIKSKHHHHHRLSIQKLKKMEETPLDPFNDFYFMNENYTDYRPLYNMAIASTSLFLSSPQTSSSQTSSLPSKETTPLYPSMFISELDENYEKDMITPTAFSKKSPLCYFNNFFQDIDQKCEEVLIKRIWNCFMRIKKYENDYYSHEFSFNQLRHTVRNNLVTFSLFMTRLRAFSRQLQPSLLRIFTAARAPAVHDVLPIQLQTALNNQSNDHNNRTAPVAASNSNHLPLANLFVHKRLSSFVYAIHVSIPNK